MTKRLSVLMICLFLISILIGACGGASSPIADNRTAQQKEQDTLEDGQQQLITKQPAPVMDYSLERENIKNRLLRFNDPNKISYLYELSQNGSIIAFYVIKGKVSSVNSYMTTSEQLICKGGRFGSNDSGGSDYQCVPMEAPDSDGSYGSNGDGIFFFLTDGTYIEWNGLYQVSDRPLQMSSTPVLVYSETITDTK